MKLRRTRLIIVGLLLVALVVATGPVFARAEITPAYTVIKYVSGTLDAPPPWDGDRYGPYTFLAMEIWLDSVSPEPGLYVGFQLVGDPIIYTWYIYPGDRVVVTQDGTQQFYAWYINDDPNTQAVTYTGRIALTG